MNDYRTDAPPILRDFLAYHETIKAHSKRTVDEYYLDLRNFFRYMKQIRNPALSGKSLDEISILDVDLNFDGYLRLYDLSQPGSRAFSKQPEFQLRFERCITCAKNRHNSLILWLFDEQNAPAS